MATRPRRSIYVDATSAKRLMDELVQQVDTKTYIKAQNRAINRAIGSGKTIASKEVRSRYAIRKNQLDPGIGINRATMTKPEARLYVTGEPIPLHRFQYRVTRKGVSVKVGKKSELIKGAFKVRGSKRPGMHNPIFARGKYDKRRFVPSKKRMPITKLTTLSTGAMFAQHHINYKTRARITEIYLKRLKHEVTREISKLGR